MKGLDSEAYLKAIEFISELDMRYENNREAGWIYVMRNEELKRPLLKIGMTRRPPHARAAEMGTGVPGHFELLYFVHVCNVRAAEQYVHAALAPHRYREDREFFTASIGRAASVLDQAAEVFPLLRSMRNKGSLNPRSKPIPQAFRARLRVCPACGTKNRVRELAIQISPTCGKCGRRLDYD